jgi:predicted ATPase/signal transduction histidine kinase
LPLEKYGFSNPLPLYASARTLVRRAVRLDDQRPVILKSLIAPHPSTGEVERLRYAAEIQQKFDHPGIVRVLEWVEAAPSPMLVLEDIGGVALTEYVKRYPEHNLPLDQFLTIAIQLAAALGEIHHQHVIHKDLHPGNIIVAPDTGQVQITDFDIASLLSREQPAQQAAEELEGILGFISPEQTGRMNRAVDYRSDFYSLGVTLYWLLTGKMPFDVKGGIAMVHAHIARIPLPAHEVRMDVPPMIGKIIDKLMAKNAEFRYQSAAGLQFDLELCAQQWSSRRAVTTFQLGQQDISERFQISQKLYGREAEVEQLLHAFSLAQSGQPQFVSVAGHPGIGKSSVVNEVHKPIAAHGGWFAAGKFDQFNQNIPYSALRSAFNTWLQLVLAEGSEALAQRREQLCEVLGANARVLVDFHPELAFLLGELPPVPDLGALETQNRFFSVMQQFIREMTRQQTLVLFLDDVQWADPGTLGLLKVLMNENGARLLLVVAYRDNEASERNPALVTLGAIEADLRSHSGRFHRIALEVLSKADVVKLLIDTLPGAEGFDQLAQLVHEKTAGNPFFINEFLKTLYGDQLINFDAKMQRWTWDIARIREQGITDNVVQLMLEKMRRLPEQTQHYMQLAACIGSRFELAILAQVGQVTVPQLSTILWPALKEGLLLLDGNRWQRESRVSAVPDSLQHTHQPRREPACRFLHDRMLQAAYESLSPVQRQQAHLAIGRYLQQRLLSEAGLDVFRIVEHLNEARDLIVQPEERLALAHLNLTAARLAKGASAWNAAARHTRVARMLLPENAWEQHYDLAAPIHLLSVECEILDAQFDAAEQLADLTLQTLRTPIEKARICFLLLNSNIVRGRRDYAVKMGVDGLRHCGISLPEPARIMAELEAETQAIAQRVAGRPLARCIQLSPGAAPVTALAANILSALFLGSYVGGNRVMCELIACKSMRLLLDHGLCDVTASLLGQYAGILVWQRQFTQASELALMAINFADKAPNKRNCLQIYLFSGSGIWFHFRPFQEAIEILWRGINAGFEYGDVAIGMGCLSNVPIVRFAKGDPLTEISANVEQLDTLMQRHKLQVSAGRHYQRLIRMLQNPQAPHQLQDSAFSELELQIVRGSTLLAFVEHLRLHWCFWSEQYAAGIEQLAVAEAVLERVPGLPPTLDHPVLKALLLSATATAENRDAVLNTLQQIEQHYIDCSQMCATNFTHKRWLVAAQIAQLQGNLQTTIDSYRSALLAARHNGFLQYEALAQEWLGRYLNGLGWNEFAAQALREAYYVYGRWGCVVKQQKLVADFPELFELPVNGLVRAISDGVPVSTGPHSFRASSQLDLESVIKSSQAISGELILDRLLKKILHIILENAGAQSAALVVERNGVLHLEALMTLDQAGNEAVVQQNLPVVDSTLLPQDLLRYVLLTDKALLIQDVATHETWSRDRYVRQTKPLSILCMPLHHRNSMAGVLYLENRLVANAFTDDRLQVLQLLLAQATISLENARLFDEVQALNAGLEQKVELRTAELKAVNRELEAFSYSVSHDLRGPLRNINGFSKMLLDQHAASLSDAGRDLLRRVCRNTDRMSNLIGGLLALAKVTRSELHVAEVNLADIANAIAEDLLQQYPQQKVEWICTATVTVKGDHRLLYSALENLLNNAWKYSAKVPRPKVEFGMLERQGRTVFFVRDNGAGFDMRYADKLFTSFQRLHNEKDFTGTGIGLATVQRIIQRHGGEVWAEAQVGAGATFYFTLGMRDSPA